MSKFIVIAALISFVSVSTDTSAELLSLDKPVTGSAYFDTPTVIFNPAQEVFPWTNVNDGFYDDTLTSRPNPQAWSYWITPGGQTGWFNIDLQNFYSIQYFEIQNTRNRDYGNDRGGKDFHISLSNDGVVFTTVLTETLPRAFGIGTAIPIETYYLQSGFLARYVRFDLDSFYGGSGGINELSVYGSPVPIPGAAWLFGSALVGLVCFSRRKSLHLSPGRMR
jgi:hypothetical protein